MLTQLNPPLPLNTPKGAAWAVAVIDYGPDHDLRWVTFLRGSGECWTWHNADIRQPRSLTNRTLISLPPHGDHPWRDQPDVQAPPNAHCPTRDAARGMGAETAPPRASRQPQPAEEQAQ